MNTRKSTEDQLFELAYVQVTDNLIRRLMELQGELPMEIRDLEDEIEGMQTRKEQLEKRKKEIQQEIRLLQGRIETAKRLITKYDAQKMQVKNNREYLALEKETELQQLEIIESEKHIAQLTKELEGSDDTPGIDEQINTLTAGIAEKQKQLESRRIELDEILADTGRELEELEELREKFWESMEQRLQKAYLRIRNNFMNKIAVVTIERDACAGCHSQVPPQRQLDIGRRQKIIVCENCGRIIVDPDLMQNATEKIRSMVKLSALQHEEETTEE